MLISSRSIAISVPVQLGESAVSSGGTIHRTPLQMTVTMLVCNMSVPTSRVLDKGGGRCSGSHFAGPLVMLTSCSMVVVLWHRCVDRQGKW
mmetsp:Transcript_42712/g.106707  ORF Transcript_42712/g.106707 Transcript_42712/m.106707 type:complete len:91 (-) Transcript_42712:272-544(-)